MSPDPADAAWARVDAELAAIEATLPPPPPPVGPGPIPADLRPHLPTGRPHLWAGPDRGWVATDPYHYHCRGDRPPIAGPLVVLPPPDPRDVHAAVWGLLIGAGLVATILGLAVGLARAAAPPARPAWLPDPRLTPGAVVALDAGAICDRGYAGRARHVTEATKREVFRRYGLAWADRDRYEVDHLVPLACGGDNDVANLWPQPWAAPLGAREKDRLEVRMRSRLCAGSIGLAAAQAAFRGDWTKAYRAEGLATPPPAAAFPPGPVAPPDPEGFGPDDDRRP